ncbi:unnamed protein product [Rhodiola kirilowii]
MQSKEDGGLGFKDWRCLNLASFFLSKQAWRLQSQPDLLVSQIMKAKYFPNSSIMDASLGYRPSHVWSSIFKALPILQQGTIRCGHTGNLTWNHPPTWIFTIKTAYNQNYYRLTRMQNKANHLICLSSMPFGKHYGNSDYLKRSKSSHGKHTKEFCPLETEIEASSGRSSYMPDLNICLHKGLTMTPRLAFYKILSLLSDFHSNSAALITESVSNALEWIRPPPNYVKINCDASWSVEEGKGAIAAWVQDSQSLTMAIRCRPIAWCKDVPDAEKAKL